MRVVVTGATGNVGTSLLDVLAVDDRIDSMVGLARRTPSIRFPKTSWHRADVAVDDLVPVFGDADAVVHLAWAIQPSRDLAYLSRVNIAGSERVFRAVAEGGVRTLVYASSVGAYAAGRKDRPVDEAWSTDGVRTSFYSRHKAQVERMLTAFEERHPSIRVVRLRPALIFKREAASEIRRYFAGPLLPGALLRRRLIPLVPDVGNLRFQAVHASDVARAYVLALTTQARGAFNIAADPVLDPERLSGLLGARPLRVPAAAIRAVVSAAWRLHLQPTPPGWVDMALRVPIMDTSRARHELRWVPEHTSEHALMELLDGLQEGAGFETPPLHPRAGGPFRIRELLSGVGRA